MVGDCVVNSQLLGEPLGQWLEAAAQDGQFVAHGFQRAAKFRRSGRNGDDGPELVEDVSRDAFQQTDALLQGCGEIQFAIHSARGNFLHSQ